MLPRRFTDFGGDNDSIYPLLEKSEGVLHIDLAAKGGVPPPPPKRKIEAIAMDADEDRQPRTLEDMRDEAEQLAKFFKDS